MKNNIKYYYFNIFYQRLIVIGLALFCFIVFSNILHAQNSSDAIAVRIVPNNEHLSAIEWYKNNNFSGSPQSLKVDGYNAVRDGRTVYVNVANVNGSTMFTNIYLISYNQQAEKGTTDIFSNILKHWQFNSNINTYGHCRQSSLTCVSDNNCGIADNCDSLKARLIRDTRRLEDLSKIRLVLINYFEDNNNQFPILNSGTYIPNASVSTWPSWADKLAATLGNTIPKDPINKLGPCPGYNEITCWNENSRLFYPGLPELASSSFAYTFSGDSNGTTGEVYEGKVDTITPTLDGDFGKMMDTVINDNAPFQAKKIPYCEQ